MTCIVIAVCKLQADTLSATLVHYCCLKHDLSLEQHDQHNLSSVCEIYTKRHQS